MIPDPLPGFDMPDHRMMLMADPPRHTELRRTINREFTPRAVERLRPRIRQLAAKIDGEAGHGGSHHHPGVIR